MVKSAVLIVAAGRGSRFDDDLPKQYHDLGGRAIITHCLANFAADPLLHYIQVVIHPDDEDLYHRATQDLKLLPPVFGGATRQESVRLGLLALQKYQPEIVLIHDGARPFVTRDLTARVMKALQQHKGAIPAIAVIDTLKSGAQGMIKTTVERANLWRAQTPQGFDYQTILSAHQKTATLNLTDDAAILEHVGIAVALVEGQEENIKITTKDQLEKARKAYKNHYFETRVGSGYDVHRLIKGDHVWLCGVKIPHDMTLEGHSDADVALHALTDALLGAMAAGDIGHHFPPSDSQWRGAPSTLFLQHAAKLLKAGGGHITHLDLTIICEQPKINPHRALFVDNLAQILSLPTSRISIKATTTEGLGFTGRGEGIAASAVVTIQTRSL